MVPEINSNPVEGLGANVRIAGCGTYCVKSPEKCGRCGMLEFLKKRDGV